MPRSKTPVPTEDELRRLYHERGWALYRIAAYFGVSKTLASQWFKNYGIPTARVIPDVPRVNSRVDHYEELPYRTTLDGRVLTRTVAILECGHKCPVSRRKDPDDYSYRPVKTCKVCTQKGREDSDGGQESGTP